MNKETAGKNLKIVREQIGLLESCINHANLNRSAFDERSTLRKKYDSVLEELRREEWDYEDIIRYSEK